MLKRNAPGVHTFLEPIRVRWGTFPHILFIFYGLVSPADSINHRYILTSVLQGTNILLTAQLITGGSSTISALTGMHTYAACCLIPTTVIAYTLVGGLRATFFSDYAHTTLIFVIILVFMVRFSALLFAPQKASKLIVVHRFQFSTFATNPNLGSPSKVYDLLQEAATNYPLDGNAQGSYTTFRSTNGLVFGIIVIISGITTVFMDQTYWQRAVASKSSTSMKGYLWGG